MHSPCGNLGHGLRSAGGSSQHHRTQQANLKKAAVVMQIFSQRRYFYPASFSKITIEKDLMFWFGICVM
jgi:hypothetical protein